MIKGLWLRLWSWWLYPPPGIRARADAAADTVSGDS